MFARIEMKLKDMFQDANSTARFLKAISDNHTVSEKMHKRNVSDIVSNLVSEISRLQTHTTIGAENKFHSSIRFNASDALIR
jgi:hypothetical protein